MGNALPVSDPNLPPYSAFYLMVTGAIESGTMNDKDGVNCKFSFTSGTDWQIHSVSILIIAHILFREMSQEFLNMLTKVSRPTVELCGTSLTR